ncbi:DNA damage-inducible transcript 3 protein [Nematostella vectensis]|nr:DNA damage-inducible transcript 3 protein [Nematostella vectensis]
METDKIMGDGFFEEYMDLSLFPGLDLDLLGSSQALPDICPSSMNDVCQSAIDNVQELEDIIADELPAFLFQEGDGPDLDVKVEVIDEAPSPIDQEITELLSSCLSSPVSDISDSAAFSIPAVDVENTEVEVEDLLKILAADPVTEAIQVIAAVQEHSTIEVEQLGFASAASLGPSISAECPAITKTEKENQKCRKRKCPTSDDELPAKRINTFSRDTKASTSIDKATERRIKNNIASRHTRAARRQREQELFEKEEYLKKNNEELKQQIVELTKETEILRKLVIQRLSSVNSA